MGDWHDVRWNCTMCTLSSRRQLSCHYYWYAVRDGSTLFARSWCSNNNLWCITTAQGVKSLTPPWVPRHFTGHWKNCIEWHSASLLSTRRMGMSYLSHFYEPERKSGSVVWKKKRGRSALKIQEWVVWWAGDVNGFLGMPRLGLNLVLPVKRSKMSQDIYFDTLMNLRNVMWPNRWGLLSQKVIMIRDNARSHRVQLIRIAERFSLRTVLTPSVLTEISAEWLSSLSLA